MEKAKSKCALTGPYCTLPFSPSPPLAGRAASHHQSTYAGYGAVQYGTVLEPRPSPFLHASLFLPPLAALEKVGSNIIVLIGKYSTVQYSTLHMVSLAEHGHCTVLYRTVPFSITVRETVAAFPSLLAAQLRSLPLLLLFLMLLLLLHAPARPQSSCPSPSGTDWHTRPAAES